MTKPFVKEYADQVNIIVPIEKLAFDLLKIERDSNETVYIFLRTYTYKYRESTKRIFNVMENYPLCAFIPFCWITEYPFGRK